jgi:hypothetical protein
MHRSIRRSAFALGLGLVAGLGSPAPASAAELIPFEIIERVDFREGGVDTFTATGPLCRSGTFVDTFPKFAGSGSRLNLMGYATFTCSDGSGTFEMRKHVHITFNEDGSFTNTGPVQLVGGTGAYADLKGHGVDNGFSDGGNFGRGVITGVVIRN